MAVQATEYTSIKEAYQENAWGDWIADRPGEALAVLLGATLLLVLLVRR
ncbi:MAG: hypothetical protein ACM3Q1_05865 [Bacteroidales bacterium]